ncbi:MAG TPA: hypothetical protein VFH61_10280, partial [Thermoleophilia bacterium]|nr:hypothetical protein [Thermoleophilia bacterium]
GDADEYLESNSLMELIGGKGIADGPLTAVTDNLSTNPLTARFRFYRVKRSDGSEVSRQTVGVFEMTLTTMPALKFISTPLIPDPDHKSAREILGEGAARQVPSSGFQVSDLNEATGAIARMRYMLPDTSVFTVLPPGATEFDIEAGVAYEVLMAGLTSKKIRFTGYVPETTLPVDIQKATSQSVRWMAYSMPRDTTLDDLGLVEAVTTWRSGNRVRLLPLNGSAWGTYAYNTTGSYWYLVTAPGVPVDPALTAGMGIVFIRADFLTPTPADVLPEVPWYTSPPNEW